MNEDEYRYYQILYREYEIHHRPLLRILPYFSYNSSAIKEEMRWLINTMLSKEIVEKCLAEYNGIYYE